MLSGRLKSANLSLLLVAAVFTRALVPLGYMPGGAGSDHWFELCPEGLPPEFMQLLSGADGHDHDHDHGHHHGHDAGDGSVHLCPIGHMLSAAAAVDDSPTAVVAEIAPSPPVVIRYDFTSQSTTHYRSRGPPA